MKGFTVIEFVATILLLGIIAATSYTRWFDTSAFESSTLKAEVLASARLAQRAALSNSAASVSLVIDRTATEYTATVTRTLAGVPAQIFRARVAVNIPLTATAGFGPVTLDAGDSLAVDFDSLGNLSGITLGTTSGSTTGITSSGLLLSVGTNTVCLSPLGYAHEGLCV